MNFPLCFFFNISLRTLFKRKWYDCRTTNYDYSERHTIIFPALMKKRSWTLHYRIVDTHATQQKLHHQKLAEASSRYEFSKERLFTM